MDNFNQSQMGYDKTEVNEFVDFILSPNINIAKKLIAIIIIVPNSCTFLIIFLVFSILFIISHPFSYMIIQ